MHDSGHSQIRHHYLRALILCGFALLIAHLSRLGNLDAYVSLRMIPYVKLSAIGLFIAAIYQIHSVMQFMRGEGMEVCDCGHDHSQSQDGSVLLYVLFLLPLVIGFLLPEEISGG